MTNETLLQESWLMKVILLRFSIHGSGGGMIP